MLNVSASAIFSSGSHYVAAGNSFFWTGDNIPSYECVQDDSTQSPTIADIEQDCHTTPVGGTTDIGVSCCNLDGSGGERDANGLNCHSPATYDEAVQFCEGAGMRLCTLDELLSDVTAGTGCGFDCRYNWVSTECSVFDDEDWGDDFETS